MMTMTTPTPVAEMSATATGHKKGEKIMKKQNYESPILEIKLIGATDIITASGGAWDDGNVDSGGWT